MAEHRIRVTILEDHRLEIRLPDEFPLGPAEVTVLTGDPLESAPVDASVEMLAALEELKSQRLSPEEERILDELESFRSEHPFDLASLIDRAR